MKNNVIRIAKAHGIDLIGFARFEDVKLAYPPRPADTLLPGAKTTIAFSGALLWGALNSPRGTKGAVKDAQVAYDRVEQGAMAIARYLESEGYPSYVPPASMPIDTIYQGRKSYYAAEWSHRQAAIAAKLGVRGLNNLLITPEFGSYVRLGSMLTTVELEPSERDLPDKLCTQCKKCVDACPVQALSVQGPGEPVLDTHKCRSNYVRPLVETKTLKTLRGFIKDRAVATLAVQTLLEGYYFSCAECQRVCPRGAAQKTIRKRARERRAKA